MSSTRDFLTNQMVYDVLFNPPITRFVSRYVPVLFVIPYTSLDEYKNISN